MIEPKLDRDGNQVVRHMDRIIGVGFGDAFVTCDGVTVYAESQLDGQSGDEYWTTREAEEAACKRPDADWRIVLNAPLWSAVYQRQGECRWVLISSGEGFA